MAASVVTVNDFLDGHVGLDIECLDRIYLNGYVPNLQVGGQVVTFLTRHLGKPIPSPAVFEQIGGRFRRAVTKFAAAGDIPVVRFDKDDRKIDVMRPYQDRLAAQGRCGVAAIGVAQEFQPVWTAYQRDTRATDLPQFTFAKAQRRVTCYYFYVVDEQFGPGFVKICSYFPYPIKVWVNGHEWAKRQATKAGIGFAELSNGFASCTDPAALQAICDQLGPAQIQAFCHRWLDALPTPLSEVDEVGGYWWEFSMRQIETSRTIVFHAPRHARAFFEALVADNLDVGRPDTVEIIFGRQIRTGPKRATPGVFKTKVVTRGVDVTVNALYRHSRIKQYLKDGRALRIETVINSPTDLRVGRRLHHLDELQGKARAINNRLLDTERVGQGCVLASPAFARVAHPTIEEGRRAPALRFGDPRVMALAGALTTCVHAVTGLSNRSLRALMTGLHGAPYSIGQASYDLRRLRLKGLIARQPHSNTYTLTPDGLRFAIFYTKVHNRILTPLLAADQPPAPPPLRQALRTIDQHLNDQLTRARLPAAR
ncbi:hypothetical protein ONA91_41085 [Micromonospora sp. DR5-3]|uniref:hypothetical protein n=1 Tax=Micromonospora sp. DR5-3 TaxID=2992129 RepID=UPI00222FC3DD|nr:hypothetical protein [Micromonospora sp. DR5-3]MCW3820835.1 hypothetical protein [Micromonospora sp. DR5-3]